MKLRYNLSAFILFVSVALIAQTKSSIIDELNAPKAGQGEVKVYIEEKVRDILEPSSTSVSNGNGHKDIDSTQTKTPGALVKRQGYKIQVFSGNDQRKSKNEAYSKQAQIKSMFPDVETAVSFHSPFWRLRAGNYKTYGEASQAMAELKKAFPALGREMYVVRDVVMVSE